MPGRPRRRRRTDSGPAAPLALPPTPPAPRLDPARQWWWWGGTGLNLLAGAHQLQQRAAQRRGAAAGSVGAVVSPAPPRAARQDYPYLSRLLAAASRGSGGSSAIADIPVASVALVWAPPASGTGGDRALSCPGGAAAFWCDSRSP